jgi:hypothetical protein
MAIKWGDTITISTQTDTHIAYDSKPFIDLKYRWNEWDLRRQALQLCNLRQKKTKSIQTVSTSHFRRDAMVQCWVHGKTSATQTRKETGTMVPQRTQYIQGLRGKKVSNAQLRELYLDLA